MIFVLQGPGPEMPARYALADASHYGDVLTPTGRNTFEEAEDLVASAQSRGALVIYVATSAYHVQRATLTIRQAMRLANYEAVLHVWGTGTVTGDQAIAEGKKLAAAQAVGHALHWEDV